MWLFELAVIGGVTGGLIGIVLYFMTNQESQ